MMELYEPISQLTHVAGLIFFSVFATMTTKFIWLMFSNHNDKLHTARYK